MQKKTLAFILIAAVIFRIAAAFFLGNEVRNLPGTNDQLSYHNLALRLLDGHAFSFSEGWWPVTPPGEPTAHWSFLYTFYVTAVYALFGPNPLAARLIQAVIVGIFHPLLVYWLGRRLFSSQIGLIAAGLVAIYPYFIYYSAALMTEPFYFLAILVSLNLAMKLAESLAQTGGKTTNQEPSSPEPMASEPGRSPSILLLSLALGASLAIAVLLRQLFLLFIPILLLWLWWANRRRINLPLVLAAICITVVIVGAILPFTLYNYNRFGRFVLLNTNAGFAFYWANHPVYGTRFVPILPPEMGNYLELIPRELRRLDEAALDQALLKEAIRIILDDPVRYLQLSLSRIPPFFMFWPTTDSDTISNLSRVGGFGTLIPFIIYGIYRSLAPGSFSPRRRIGAALILVYLFILFYTGIHVLTWTLVRYRLPIDSLLMLFAALGIRDLWSRWISPRKLPSSVPSDSF